MSPETPNFGPSQEKSESLNKHERIELAERLQGEVFSFPGIPDGVYADLVREEKDLKELLPRDAFNTLDEVIQRFEKKGMKVMLGTHPDSGNVFIVPAESRRRDLQKTAYSPAI